MAVMTGTGGTAKWRVTCTGAVCQGWSSQPAGGLGGSETGGGLAAGEPGVPGAAGVPGDVAGAGGDADAGGDTDAAGDTDDAGDDDPRPGGAAPAALPPAPQAAVATAVARNAAINAVEYVLGRCIVTSVASQPRSRRSPHGNGSPARAMAGWNLSRSALSAPAGCCPGRGREGRRSRTTAAR